MASSVPADWATWQLVDSLLPTGAFAHSLGLEAALRHGFLNTLGGGVTPPSTPAPAGGGGGGGGVGAPSASSVRVFALSSLANVASQLLPFVAASHAAMGPALGPSHSPGLSCSAKSGDRALFLSLARGAERFLFHPEEEEEEPGLGPAWEEEEGEQASAGAAGKGTGVGLAGLGLPGVAEWSVAGAVGVWALLDTGLHACLTNHVARRASCSQGQALLRVATSMTAAATDNSSSTDLSSNSAPGGGAHFAPGAASVLRLLRARMLQPQQQPQSVGLPSEVVAAGGAGVAAAGAASGGEGRASAGAKKAARRECVPKGHHATVFGAVAALMGLPRETACRAYLYGVLRDVLSSATRLSLVGPLQAATLHTTLAPQAERMLRQSMAAVLPNVPAWQGPTVPTVGPTGHSGSMSGSAQGSPGAGAGVVGSSEESVGLGSLVGGSCVQCPMLDVLQAAHDALPLRLFLS